MRGKGGREDCLVQREREVDRGQERVCVGLSLNHIDTHVMIPRDRHRTFTMGLACG